MPLDIRSQVVTALDNVNKNPELYTPPKPTTPLETRINDLKETNPNKYREHISTLTSSANSGNEEARELLGKIGEDAARQRRGYEGLNTAMYAPAIIGAGALAIMDDKRPKENLLQEIIKMLFYQEWVIL